MLSMLDADKRDVGAHENQGGVEILVVFLHVFGVVLHRLPFVHGVEVELGVTSFDWLEIHPEGLLDAIWSQPMQSTLGLENAPLVVNVNRFRIFPAAHRDTLLLGRVGKRIRIRPSRPWRSVSRFTPSQICLCT